VAKVFLLREEFDQTMKWLTGILLFLLLILQYTLWFGNGGLLRVWQISGLVREQEAENAQLLERNQALEAEVMDLKEGITAIEERARSDLGMIKQGETFFQVIEE
jgi:cell division protein FtsB